MRRWNAILWAALCAGPTLAAEPLPEPAPEPAPPPYAEIRPWTRANRYDIWQNLAVDRHGYFRPRVVYTPEGSFYYFDGRYYPFMMNRPREFMPYASE